ncbi:sigma factor-like helix-turn-helix DNA-binding protein [Streptomyces sp. MBT84]|uniref:sigma factor-like helix-turn-helix DNA-binding protein n=1 Tax=Streptomyces sp. MBT84 TaxID=1488414 RepID=UPI0020767476|nr:sigma factor-like helix-turn-helix DNA-binding protein [Streptomyces sp. MBT84]
MLLESDADHPNQDDGRSAGRGDGSADVFLGTTPKLFAIGMRILHDVGEAQDIVQETWLRWVRTDHSVVVCPPAFLATVAARLAINVSQSARWRREILASPWLPESADFSAEPGTAVEHQEAVHTAIMLLMERLPPTERAVYLLRTAFDYPYARISEVLHVREAYARQLMRRARTHLTTARRRPVSTTAHRRLVRAFRQAADTLDLSELEELLVADLARQVAMPAVPPHRRAVVEGC